MTNVEAPKEAEKPKAEVSPLIPLRKGAVAMIAKKIIAGLIIFLIFHSINLFSIKINRPRIFSYIGRFHLFFFENYTDDFIYRNNNGK